MHRAAQSKSAGLLLLFQIKRALGFSSMNCLSGVSDRFVTNRSELEYHLVSEGNCVRLPADSMRLGLKTPIKPVPLWYDDDDFDF